MKIVHLFWGLGTGGIETMLVNIANEQIKLGHKLYIIIINDLINDNLKNSFLKDICFICLKRKLRSKNPLFIALLNKELLRISPDIIHFHEANIIKYILPNWRKISVLTVHHLPGSKLIGYYHSFSEVYAISDSVRNELRKYHNIESKTIYNGILTKKFKIRDEKKDVMKIVQVGRLFHNIKGQDLLIIAFGRLIEKGYRHLSLSIVGEGDSECYLKNLVKDCKLEDYVHFVGMWQQDYLVEHLSDFDLFVQPSRFEGFGLTVAEAMAAKVPVLVSDNQGPMEVINNGEYGYCFKNDNIDDCVNKLESIIVNGVDWNMVEKAFVYVKQMFDVKITAK